jgi:DNA-binding transcriptional regulator YdaS (Cro superfamily)
MNTTTHPLQDYPGYYYNWVAPLQQWGMRWHPVRGTYSPPQLDQSLQWVHLSPPQGLNMVPLLGDGDMHCEKMAQEIGATYLYYRQDLGKIEVWSQDIAHAMVQLSVHLNRIRSQHKTAAARPLVPPPS